MQFSVSEFAGFKNKYMSINKKFKKNCISSAHSWGGEGVLGKFRSFKNVRFFYVLYRIVVFNEIALFLRQ